MNNSKFWIQIAFLFIIAITINSCSKKDCEFKSKYIYEPIEFDETCNCIVSGKVKYLKDCVTVILIDYGNGTCDNIATKTICVNGKCELRAGATIEEFEFDCLDSIIEGPISEAEALDLGI